MSDLETGAAEIRRVTIAGAVLNVLLALAKLAGGILASSQALVADAVHSLSDLFTDAAIIVGVKYWVMPADKEHPYGHGKIEGAVTALIGVAVAVVAVEIAWDGIKTLAWGRAEGAGARGVLRGVGLGRREGGTLPLDAHRGQTAEFPRDGGERLAPPVRRDQLAASSRGGGGRALLSVVEVA